MFSRVKRLVCALALLACAPTPEAPEATIPTRYWGDGQAPHSAAMALDLEATVAVLPHPDSDTVAFVDLARRTILAEVALGPTPSLDRDGRWVPPVMPVSVAIAPHRRRAYVVGRNDGGLVALDLDTRRVVARAPACTEPVAVLVGPAEAQLLVACAADAELVALDARTLSLQTRAALPAEPGAMALTDGGGLVVMHPHTGGVTRLDARTLRVVTRTTLAPGADRGHPLLAQGTPRALTDLAQRPGTQELWLTHTLLSTTTAQPSLNFETTVFPAVSVLDAEAPEGGRVRPLMTTDSRLAGIDGALLHIVSGPRAVAFTPDGLRALVLNLDSENLTVIDCARGEEVAFLEDLPGAMPDAIAVHPDGRRAWISARNAGVMIPLALDADGSVRVDGAAFPTRTHDPMPRALRMGQWMFYNANDRYQMFPITVNHWLSCQSCHMGGGSASVTQRMAVGPRDIPDLRQGIDGFLMRTATRRGLTDFWRTIQVEQGGSIRPDDDIFGPYFDALMDYVERAIPPLHPPHTDAALVARGRSVFERADVGCVRCHGGARLTDSGAANPSLDLAGEVRLWDVGTCVRDGPWPDLPHEDIARHGRDACRFDTPTLRGVGRTGPWLHDGSAATLRDVLTSHNGDGLHGATRHLHPDELDALVEFLRAQ